MSDIEDQQEKYKDHPSLDECPAKFGGAAFCDQKPGNSIGLMIFSVAVLIVTTVYTIYMFG